MADDPEYVTVAEAAKMLGITDAAVRYHYRAGHLTPYKRLGTIVLRREEVVKFGEVKPRQPRPPAPDQQP